MHTWKFDQDMHGAFPLNIVQLTDFITQNFVREQEPVIVCMTHVLASLKMYRRPKNYNYRQINALAMRFICFKLLELFMWVIGEAINLHF